MKPIATSLVHRVRLPEHSAASAHPALIMLHGRGADEQDLLGLASRLDHRLMVLSVRAPFPFPWGGGYTWYEIREDMTHDRAMFGESYAKLVTFVDDARRHYPIDPRRCFLLGFSMGTVMSYALALTMPGAFRGVAANSGYLPEGTALNFAWEGVSGLDFFIAHGTGDPVIPVSYARRARDLFEKAHAHIQYKEYPMAHEISEESLNDLARWLARLLDNDGPDRA